MNVGDFVRTKDGALGKIIDKYKINDYYKIKVDIRNGWIEKHREDLFKKHIIKSSPQIIDLIEKDDLLKIEYRLLPNATQTEIVQVIENKDKKLFVHLWKGDYFIEDIVKIGMIKQILTHEQFESIAYRVEE